MHSTPGQRGRSFHLQIAPRKTSAEKRVLSAKVRGRSSVVAFSAGPSLCGSGSTPDVRVESLGSALGVHQA